MARVLFVETDIRNEKLGIMYLSAALKKNGHRTMLCWYEKEDIDNLIESFSPDYVAFSLVTGTHRRSLDIAGEIKNRYNKAIIVGGPHATFFSHGIPEAAADFIIVGHGETAIIDIVEGRTQDRLLKYNFCDLNEISFPDRELFYRFKEFRDNPMKNVITTRDCPYSCSYCYNHSWKRMFMGQQHFMQRRNVDNVIEEIEGIKKDYILDKVLFIDDNFLVHEGWIEEFCEKYKKEIGLPFLCSFRINMQDEAKLRMLKDAGLYMVNFALESADPVVQRDILKRGNINNEEIIKAIGLFKKYGIKSRMQNMIGLPLKESFKDAMNTLRFNKEHQVVDSWVSVFQPYPSTELAEYCVKNGFVDGDIEEKIAESFFGKSFLNIDNREKIDRLQKWWFFIVKYNFSDELIDIILKIDINNSIGQSLQNLRYKFSRKYLYGIADENDDLLDYNEEEIYKNLGSARNFNIWGNIINKYKLCVELSKILMEIYIPEGISKEIYNATSMA